MPSRVPSCHTTAQRVDFHPYRSHVIPFGEEDEGLAEPGAKVVDGVALLQLEKGGGGLELFPPGRGIAGSPDPPGEVEVEYLDRNDRET